MQRRHQSPTLSDDPYDIPQKPALPDIASRRLEDTGHRERKERSKRRGDSDASDDERSRAKRKEKRKKEKAVAATSTGALGEGLASFDMPYVKKGGVREWDVGK